MHRWSAPADAAAERAPTTNGRLLPTAAVVSCETPHGVYHFGDTTVHFRQTDVALGRFIWFGTADDSLEISTSNGVLATNLGLQLDSLHNSVPYFGVRLQHDGVVAVETQIDIDDGFNVPYTLTIARSGAALPAALTPTCGRARLTIVSSRPVDHFSIVPVSLARSVHDLSKWTTFTGVYGVALVSDSLYQICRTPCVRPDTVKLRPGASVTRHY